MPRRVFYKVPEHSFLFGKSLETGQEEEIRQWCAFELMRYYGYSICDFTAEHPVKVGSKQYRIDILIKKDGVPFVVVECKKSSHTKHTNGVEQAKSYANADSIQAPFILYTNGSKWHVEHKIGTEWFKCIDVPRFFETSVDESLEELYLDLKDIGTLIHKLDTLLTGANARQFLDVMQAFFSRTSRFTQSTDRQLSNAVDLALRTIIHYKTNDLHYIGSKLRSAIGSIEEYRLQANVGYECPILETEHGFRRPFQQIRSYLFSMLDGSKGIANENTYALKILVSLFDYAKNLPDAGEEYHEIPMSIHRAVRDYLNFNLTLHLNMKLPDPNEGFDFQELQRNCFECWKDHKPF